MRAPTLWQLIVGHWEVAWPLDVQAAVYVSAYLWAVRTTRGRWAVRRTAAFLAGIASVLIALQSGIDAFDDQLLSVHMVQHMILLLAAPMLLLGGQPVLLGLRVLGPEHGRDLVRVMARVRSFTGPVACLAFFWVVVLLTHVPSFYDATLRSSALHETEHALYLLAGLLLWWHVLAGDPVRSRQLRGLPILCYVLAAMLPMTIVGAYLNRHAALVYAGYGPPARALGISPLADQAQAGAIMWVGGGTIMIAVGLWAAMAALTAEERRQQRREANQAPVVVELRGPTRSGSRR